MIVLNIKNVGKIRKAKLEVAGISVIAGLNGTGKSTLSKSLFAALNSKKNIASKIRFDMSYDIERSIDDWIDSDLCAEFREEDEFGNVDFDMSEELSGSIMEAWSAHKWEGPEKVYAGVHDLLKTYCNENYLEIIDDSALVENIRSVLERSERDYIEFFVGQYYNEVFKRQINCIGSERRAVFEYHKTEQDKDIYSIVEFADNKIVIKGKLLTAQQENAVYIETRSVLDACGDMGNRVYARLRRGDRLTIPTKELFEQLYAEKRLSFAEQRKMEKSKSIIEDIVAHVTHGSLVLNKSGDFDFMDDTIKQKIEFSNMSSGLKIFVVIQKLLENYSLKSGDVLLVDEPEVNLHPEWQVFLAQVMVRMHKELGIYLVVNSHSPYFIRAIEVKMAEYECALDGRFYYLSEQNGMCICDDVTDETNVIYEALYQPLNYL